MELFPRFPRNIQESTSSSSSELQPFINLDDRRSLQVQDEISDLKQQQQLYDCEKEQIRLRDEIRVLLELMDNSGMRLKQLEDDTRMKLMTCLQEKENKERESAALEDTAKSIKEELERFETVEGHQKEQMARLSSQLESLQSENTSMSINLQRSNLEVKALNKEIKNLQMQLLEESDYLLPIEKRNMRPASESKHSTSASAELRNILDKMGCELKPK
ncbi:CAP-Gly domain-containing linker protein 1-like isoform X3 [Phoenix dactylifera]|uniref:CAP-Gly domain-containing linker protein 1-like isoform X3 n=1 Tax=Phoenix dactylifera TaxID=42345 RepID=A0A8B8ZXJ0_PHODC|nr:CAP-Gly domain-containing linker protein 1-like isoform X3 [Phoenix dactylifera]